MEKITIDEENKKRIKKYLKSAIISYDEKDIELLEKDNQLTERLAYKVFRELMRDSQRIRDILEPEGEFKEQIAQAFKQFDAIQKNDLYNMGIEEIFSNMQTCFELKEAESTHYRAIDLRRIAETVIHSIDGVDKYKIELQPEAKEELQKIQEELGSLLKADKTDIQGIQDRVNKYNNYAIQIWNDYITDVGNETDDKFRYVVHNLTSGVIEGDFRTKYMSTSLITNNTMGVYGQSRCGLIIKPKHIISACYKDTYTNNYRENEDELFNIQPAIQLPQEIEEICVQQTIETNGEMLNYEKESIYPEIVVDEYEIEGIYYISNGEHELSPNYERARKMAEDRGLPLKEKDISKERIKKGLEPMTENSQKNFCKNILYKYCIGNEILERNNSQYGSTFVNNNYQNLYERYMKLKERGEFTKEDLLKEFRQVILDDDVQRWERMEFYHSGFFTGELTEEDSRYIINTRFDFSKCNSYEEFAQLYSRFCDVADGRFVDEKLGQYVSERFNNRDAIMFVKSNPQELRRIFESGERSLDGILAQIYARDSEEEKRTQVEQSQEEIAEESTVMIDECGEIVRPNNNEQTEDYWQSWQEIQTISQPTNAKIHKQKQPEKLKAREESIRDEVGDKKDIERNMQMQEKQSSTVDLWTNRFINYYSAIDRVSQNVKAKFVEMKSNIIKAITEKLTERTSHRQVNTQKQDTNER